MLTRLGFPSVGEHRRFVAAIVADTVGSGLFMPITLLYFLAMTDLSLVQVGSALSLSALLSMPAAFVIGTLVDRFGPRRMMLAGNLVQAAGMVAYLWADSLLAVALWTALLNLGRQSFWGSFGNVVTAISAPGERELWFGFLQAVRNLGFSVGGVLAGVALQIGTDAAYQSVVVVNAVTFVLAFVLLLDVPDHRVAQDRRRAGRGLGRRAARPGLPAARGRPVRLRGRDDGAQLRPAGLRRRDDRPARVGRRRDLHAQHRARRPRAGTRRTPDDRAACAAG